ncbi:MAG TPA: class I SAM-dependent methyltransferase [Thermodesulfobacteriota bacterium]|nr:class I SAM-dependent methyltransferase [Thermodesulfobacteriota bacterium]
MKGEELAPLKIQSVIWNGTFIHILNSALELGVFDAIYKGAHDIKDIAREIEASQRGTRILLDALAVIGFIRKKDCKYHLTSESESFLVSGKPTCLSDFIMLHGENTRLLWSSLSKAVRSGRGIEYENPGKGEFYRRLASGLFVLNYPLAWRLVRILLMDKIVRYLNILDVAAGSAPWSIAMAEANPDSLVTAIDLPEVLEITRGYVERHGLEKRFRYVASDINRSNFGEERYDIAVLGNICHSLGEEGSERLFSRLYTCLKDRGEIIVIDTIVDEEREESFFPLLFALVMLLNTPNGDTFTFSQFKRWLLSAGFTNIRRVDLSLETAAIIAQK